MQSSDKQMIEIAGYHLVSLIGSGGMGDVYKAYHSSLNRYAAVKVLHLREAEERFKNEANIQSSISHPNIARLYEFVSTGTKHCIIMEYVEGESLDALLRKRGKLTSAETENIVRQIVSALVYLHDRKIIHRDIKPSNFKIQPDAVVKMLDFGIAKHRYSPRLTQQGFVVGTLEYIAPEQLQQKPELKSDIWALSVMIYEMITGYLPFEAATPVVLRTKILKGDFTNPKLLIPEISDMLAIILDKGLRVNVSERLSAAETEQLLNGKKNAFATPQFFNLLLANKRIVMPVIAAFLLIVFLLFRGDKNNTDGYEEHMNTGAGIVPVKQGAEDPAAKSIMINATGVANAEMIFNDGTRQSLPYPVTGREGEKKEFIIRANGYKDKKVAIEITSRRSSYEITLEKNTY